ncbi:HNH endonuclease [Mycobacterium intracellulare subsp. chimaera]|nr:HNH endonuclease [Mycobacterium intracellulare subsp. chimaera]PBA63423.1 HNH endonuclease [Mycobacterium intracellulare subsp. chimaera]
MLSKPCLVCGEDAEPGTSRCADCQPKRTTTLSRVERHRTSAWDRLSARLRKTSPFCEKCGTTTDLTVDHIIPLAEDPTLALEPLNCRVLCRFHNGQRQHHCADAERQAVHAAINARKQRTAHVATSP